MDELRTFAEIAEPRLEPNYFRLPDRLNSDFTGEVAPPQWGKSMGQQCRARQEVAQQPADSLETIANIEDVIQLTGPELNSFIVARSRRAIRFGPQRH